MQTTLEFWKTKCEDEDGKIQAPIKILKGRKPTHTVKDKAVKTPRRKGNSTSISQIQGQSKILSFLEPKNNSMTPSIPFPNSSVIISNNTTDADSCTNLVGNKTTEARNETGGGTEQLTGESNLKTVFVRDDTIGQN